MNWNNLPSVQEIMMENDCIDSSPVQLSEINAVYILILDGGSFHSLNLDNLPYKRIEGKNAQLIAKLFRQLPIGNAARCHIPPFGLGFHTQEDLRIQCSLCWECNNIRGDIHYDFDANHSVSKQLLTLLRKLSN